MPVWRAVVEDLSSPTASRSFCPLCPPCAAARCVSLQLYQAGSLALVWWAVLATWHLQTSPSLGISRYLLGPRRQGSDMPIMTSCNTPVTISMA